MKKIVGILLLVVVCGCVSVVSAADAPVAVDDRYDYYWTQHGSPFSVIPNLLSNDYDPSGLSLTVEVVSDPAHGSLTNYGDGTFFYEPDWYFLGEDTFMYRVWNGLQYSEAACVTIDVHPNFEAPRAVQDKYTAVRDTTLVVSTSEGVLANDGGVTYIPEQLCADLIKDPDHGTLSLNLDGSFEYTPDVGFAGTDEFCYVASPSWDPYAFSLYTPVTITVGDSVSVPEFTGYIMVVPGIILALFGIAVSMRKRR